MSGISFFNESGVEIIVREDGYINATALCKQANKLFKDYYKTNTTKSFLEELSAVENIILTTLVQVKQGGAPQEQGTWLHPLAAINLAQWLSPKYAVLVTKVMQKFHKGELVAQYDQSKQLLQKVTETEATASIFRSFHNIGTLAGFKGKQLTLAANLATRKLTWIDSLELMELTHLLPIEVQEALLIPKQIGERLGGLSSIKVNKMLEALGLQVQTSYISKGNVTKRFWELTEKGKQHGIYVDTSRKHCNGTPVRNIKWYESVIELLKGKAKQ